MTLQVRIKSLFKTENIIIYLYPKIKPVIISCISNEIFSMSKIL